MKKVKNALDEIKEINNTYEISNDSINQIIGEIAEAKVCTPIIGKFSSGKSALVNTVLGYNRKILKEDITPETAIPAEIVYSESEDSVTIIKNDGKRENISVDEYRNYSADATTVKFARVCLNNSFLEEIPDIMLVDMPGFESGFEIHNKAIDNYLPQSLAYIIAFPADDMIVRSSVGNILSELCLHNMPICVVITKYDKRNDEFEASFEHMKGSLKRYVGDKEIYYCRTSSFTGDAEELEVFLKEIQEKSQKILADKFTAPTLAALETTENYLKTMLNNSQMSESELSEEEEKLNNQLNGLNSKLNDEQKSFDQQVADCVEEIKSDVRLGLEAEESTLVAMAMNGQEINEHLNNVVRRKLTESVKKRFIPIVDKYLKKVSECINAESIGDIHISYNFDCEKISKGIVSSIVAVAAGLLMGLPIIGAVVAIFLKLRSNKKRDEAKQKIRMKLRNEVFPQVLSEVGKSIEMTIEKQMLKINTSIEKEIENQRVTLNKALSDLRNRMNDEKSKKEDLETSIKNDLERIGEIRNDLR